ncbi:Polysaccharide deacetylase [Roseivivax halotolerans]|uniref:Polysaccharide deacetylase n=1 Tax=Roseivivax halotolerans TaxID=93684 RepID=A0A1I6A2L4_9RHOB|nr:polysaccharide deacetylase family protein [Roseivivax halotolerans]SFQ62898.1 Polysaccharide deacetylase [Roseivivax halotolerans]
MTGSFVISLDFELMWGVRDHRSVQDYGDAVLGGREAIPHMLARFEAAGVRATWATVGLLFARNRDEMLSFAPRDRPAYEDPGLSPYADIENRLIGENEQADPMHFGASLIDRIAETPGQELATHTYSHYYCLEPGADADSFEADLAAAAAIAGHSGHKLQSIVYPRNQMSEAFIERGAGQGITAYRGDARGWLYRPRADAETTRLFRLARFIDGALPLGPKQVVQPDHDGQAWNVPASRFFRPWSKKLAFYHALHIRRIETEMELAARQGRCYHLWWHPHNFGRNTTENFVGLDRVIECFRRCSDEFGMVSRTMHDFTVS